MKDQLEKLQALRAKAAAKIEELKTERSAITDAVEAREDSDLTESEAADYRAKTEEINAKKAVLADLDEQIRDLEADIERAGTDKEEVREIAKASAKVVSEPRAYEKGNGQSYFADLARSAVNQADEAVKERLARHSVDVATDPALRKLGMVGAEYRNLDRQQGSGGYAVPPLWMMERFIELARAGRTYANLVPTEALPPGTASINIPKILTGTAAAIQTADNASLTGPGANETDLTDGAVQANVKTIAGQNGVAIQLLDQSPIAFDELVFRDLAADYATKLNIQVHSGSGSSGQVTGVRNTAGIITVSATDAGTELSKAQTVYKKIGDAIQRIHVQRFLEPEVIVMHPRRWGAFNSLFASDGRPFIVPSGPALNQAGVFERVASQRVVGEMHGLPVVTDPTLPITLGAGTNEDVIHVLRVSDLALFESSLRTRALVETRAERLTVLLQVYGYLAFTAGRFPQSVAEVSGTALTAPTFA